MVKLEIDIAKKDAHKRLENIPLNCPSMLHAFSLNRPLDRVGSLSCYDCVCVSVYPPDSPGNSEGWNSEEFFFYGLAKC